MPLPSLAAWKEATSLKIYRRKGALVEVDNALHAYYANPNRSARIKLLNLRAALDRLLDEKRAKYNGDYTRSKRHKPENRMNFDRLGIEIAHALRALPITGARQTAIRVAGQLLDVKMADVDFSSSVRAASKLKMFNGVSCYDRVKNEWEGGAGSVPVDVGYGRMQSPWQQHDASMSQAKLIARQQGNPRGLSVAQLNRIAAIVKQHRYAVCESITATVIAECHAANIPCQMEWIGVDYGKKSGHSVAVFDRHGNIDDPRTWGDDCFIVDLWYHNLGMRPSFIYADGAKDAFIAKEIKKHKGWKVMACVN